MNVLIAVASKHGATFQIANTIGKTLDEAGIPNDVRTINVWPELLDYDAVILGSAIYMGKWMPEAQQFIDTHSAELSSRKVWLFSSGPLGEEDPKPDDNPALTEKLLAITGAREHRIFAGRLAPDELGIGEKLVAKAVHAPAGDFRDWDEITAWAATIGQALLAESHAVPSVR